MSESRLAPIILILGLALLCSSCAQAAGGPIEPALQPFPPSAVSLAAGSQEAKAAELNAQYLRMIEPDSLLWTFRANAGLPTPGTPFWKVRRPRAHHTACEDVQLKKQGFTPTWAATPT